MADTANTHRDPPHPDEHGKRSNHDQAGRGSGPYAPAGRDDQGNPVPSVPHEGLLGRIATSLVAGEAVVLAAVGVAGVVSSWGASFTAQVPDTVLALRLNPAHSVLLLVTAVLAAVSLTSRTRLRWFAGLQAVVYLLLFAFGAAYSLNTGSATFLDLNTPDLVLHAVLALLGFVVLMISSARIIEPPPGPLPYPDAVPSAQKNENENENEQS